MYINTEEEIWKDAKGYEGYYQVSSLGNVRSVDREIVTSDGIKKKIKGKPRSTVLAGRDRVYPTVVFSVKGKNKRKYVHRLVAKAFIENPEGKSEVNHVDGNKLNNNVDNLEWATSSENRQHAHDEHLLISPVGEQNGLSKLTEKEVLRIRDLYKNHQVSQKEIAKTFNVTQMNIWNIVNRKTWKHI